MVTSPPIQWLAPLLVWFTSVPSPWALLPACQDALGSQLPMSIAECGLRPGGRPLSALWSVIFFRTYSPWGSTLPSIFVLCWIKSVNKWKTSPNFSLFTCLFPPLNTSPNFGLLPTPPHLRLLPFPLYPSLLFPFPSSKYLYRILLSLEHTEVRGMQR